MRTVNHHGYWLGGEPLKPHKDIVKHGASQSVKDFIAGQFSGTTPVTDGNNVDKYSDRRLDPHDLREENTFNPEIEDRFIERQVLAQKQAELLLKQQQLQQQKELAHKQEFERYKEYYEKSAKAQANADQS